MTATGDGDTLGTLAAGRYVMSRILGTGASAEVYQARDTLLGVDRAVKVLHPHVGLGESVKQRLIAEARAMAGIDHRHVLRVYDVGEDEGRPFVVMDLATGGNLARFVDERGPISESVALRYGLQVLSALAAAHARGIVHRDVKPHNVLLDDKGVALLADFGIALHADDDSLRSTRTGMALGTLAFMAPEQRLDARSVGPGADLYAVGASLFFLITGDNPVDLFAAGPESDRWRGLSVPVRDLLVRATRYEPSARYPNAAEMAKDIVAALQTDGAVREDPLDPRQFPEPSTRISTGGRPMSADTFELPAVAPTLEWEAATAEAIHTLLEEPAPEYPRAPPRRPLLGPSASGDADGARSALRRYLPLLLLLMGVVATALVGWMSGAPPEIAGVEVPSPSPAPVEPLPVPLEVEVAVASPTPAPAVLEPAPVVAPTGPRPSPRPVPATPEPAAAPAGPPPIGRWTGAFNGRPAVFVLGGTHEALVGSVTVRFGSNEVRSDVRGSYDPVPHTLVLEDQIDSIDAGSYTATLSADGTSLEGRFEGRHNGRLSPFSLRVTP